MKIGGFFAVLSFCILSAVPAFADQLYSNGAYIGTDEAWQVDDGYATSNSFDVLADSTVTGFDFTVWVPEQDLVTGIDWAVGTSDLGSDVDSGTASLTSVYDLTNEYGYDIDTLTASGLDVPLAAGTYWLTLQNATDNDDQPVTWDINNGPSAAFNSYEGSLANTFCSDNAQTCTGSESFDIVGTSGASATPEPGSIGLMAGGIFLLAGALRRRLV